MLHKILRFTASTACNLLWLVFCTELCVSCIKLEKRYMIIHSLWLGKKVWYKMKNNWNFFAIYSWTNRQYFFLALVKLTFCIVSTFFASALWDLAGMEVPRNWVILTFFRCPSFVTVIKQALYFWKFGGWFEPKSLCNLTASGSNRKVIQQLFWHLTSWMPTCKRKLLSLSVKVTPHGDMVPWSLPLTTLTLNTV